MKLFKKILFVSICVLGFSASSFVAAVGWGTGIAAVTQESIIRDKKADLQARVALLLAAHTMNQQAHDGWIAIVQAANSTVLVNQLNGLIILMEQGQQVALPVAQPGEQKQLAQVEEAKLPQAAEVKPQEEVKQVGVDVKDAAPQAVAAQPAEVKQEAADQKAQPGFSESLGACGTSCQKSFKAACVLVASVIAVYYAIIHGLPEAEILWASVASCWKLGIEMLPALMQRILPAVDISLIDGSCMFVTKALLFEKAAKTFGALATGLGSVYLSIRSLVNLVKSTGSMAHSGKDVTVATWNSMKAGVRAVGQVKNRVQGWLTWPVR